ncbi:MAG: hypothetical protein LBT50_02635, partial [Prevotellaceae bacterium]|nr:hypothetical protein [Prevotellaceae bacterium]
MARSKFSYFNSLSDTEKYILTLAAVYAGRFSEENIITLAYKCDKKVLQRAVVESCLADAGKAKLITQKHTWQKIYDMNLSFLIHIYPSITETLIRAEKKIPTSFYANYYYMDQQAILLKKLLFSLLCQDDISVSKSNATNFSKYSGNANACYFEIFQNDDYLNVLYKLDINHISNLIAEEFERKLKFFTTVDELDKIISRISPYLPALDITRFKANVSFLAGEFDEALNLWSESEHGYEYNVANAVKSLTEGNIQDAFASFEKALKIQRQKLKSALIPMEFRAATYYMLTLLRMDLNISLPLFRKIEESFSHGASSSTESIILFRPVNLYILNDNRLSTYQKYLEEKFNEKRMDALVALIVFYLCDFILEKKYLSHLINLIDAAYDRKMYILGYEAAYALKKLQSNEISESLYERFAQKLNYQSILSKIRKQEEWEKTMAMLLQLQTDKKTTTNKNEAVARVAYYFDPVNLSIQPIVQTRQVKGWSKGRKIAFSVFCKEEIAGMTEQDLRIANAISKSTNYSSVRYYNEYTSEKKFFKELIGHPYVFLSDSNNVFVEFVAAHPSMQILKTDKGYTLGVDIDKIISERYIAAMKESDTQVIVSKETNTRYRVYELTKKQLLTLTIIKSKELVIPEYGKERLIELMGGFSGQGMDVHSDLQVNESQTVEVVEIPPDSRTRVQILPFGDGLKAELFAKPFGTHPPYCKPGKGGKILIQNNEDNIQHQVKRDFETELGNETALMNDIQSLESIEINDGLITFEDPMDSLYLLDILKDHRDISVVEWPEGEKYKIKGTAGFSSLSLKLNSGINWFDLDGELTIDEDTVVSLQQLLTLTEKGHFRFIELSEGEFLALTDDLRKRLDDLRMFSSIDKKQLKINKFAAVALSDLFEDVENLQTDKAWKEFNERVKNQGMQDVAIPSNLQAELRPYQEDGFRWMARLASWEGGACLADDMGLGKTIQTLAILLHRAQLGVALVVCPVSVIGNWVAEIERFAPSLQVKTMGNTYREQLIDDLQTGDILITSYGLLQSEEKLFSKPVFSTIVLDEAHTIKNFATKT